MNIKNYSLIFLFSLLFTLKSVAASLGFKGPSKMLNPGEEFEISVVAYFDSGEVSSWNHSPLLNATVVWPDTIYVVSCKWNSAQWNFDFNNTYFEQTITTALLWARATAKAGVITPGAEVEIAKLKCVGLEYEDDSFFYDTFENYYGYYNGRYLDTTNCSVIYTNVPTSMTYEGEDVLGAANVYDDGIDEFPILISDEPGCTLTVLPEEREIPFARRSTDIDVVIDCPPGVPSYDHVRAAIDFDSDVLSNVAVEVLPSFFTSVTATAIVGNAVSVITNSDGNVNCVTSFIEQIVVEGFCEATNFSGNFAKIKMIPIDIDETYLEFDTEGTYISKFDVVDLLGDSDDEDDGVFDAEINVRYADGLCVSFEPLENVGISDEPCEAKVVLRKLTDGDVILDGIELDALFNSNLIKSNELYFLPSEILNGQDVDYYFDVVPNDLYEYQNYPTDSVRYTDCIAEFYISWDELPMIMTSNEIVLGTIIFIPKKEGDAGFIYGYGSVEYSGADFSDPNAWAVNWPVLISVVSESDLSKQLFAGMILSTNNTETFKPGSEVSLSACVCGFASNVNYSLNWSYDPTVVELLPESEGVTVLHLTNGITVLHIAGEAKDFIEETNEIALLQFKGLRAGNAELKPVTPDQSSDLYCYINDIYSNDLLGSSVTLGDGVSEFQLIIQEAEDVYLTCKPEGMLYAGIDANVVLTVNDPMKSEWNEVSATVEFDSDEIILLKNKWDILLKPDEIKSVDENWIKIIAEPTGLTNYYGEEITNYTTMAKIHLFTKNTITNSKNIASVNLFALEDDPYWCFDIGTGLYDYANTKVAYNGVLKINDDRIEEPEWNVYPNGIGIWLSSPTNPPVLGANYTLNTTVGNPHNFNVSYVDLCWSFDSAQVEVESVKLLNGFTTNFPGGGIWVDNNNDGDGYICAKLHAKIPSSESEVKPLGITIFPKLNEVIEIYPDDDVFYDDREIYPGVYGTHGIKEEYNMLETLGQDYSDVCPEWRRGVIWKPVPQIVFDDIYLDKNESYVIEDLLDPTEGLVNGSKDKRYIWWTEGNTHINVSFNQALMSATVTPETDWVGEEIFDVFCREVDSPLIGHTKLRVVVGEDEFDFNISVERDKFLTITDYLFDEVSFNVENQTNPVLISAWFIAPDRQTNVIDVIDSISGDVVTNEKVWSNGKLLIKTPKIPGILKCYIEGRTVKNNKLSPILARANFTVVTQLPYEDDDGDRFIILYNHQAIALGKRSVVISNGRDNDQLKIKLILKKGDGLIKLDKLISDAGFKSIFIPGSVNLIETGGAIKRLRIDRGSLGLVNVAKGGIHSIIINNPFHKKEEDFMEAGIIKGIICNGDLDSVIVHGGDIGIDDEPALIKVSNGNVKRIIATMNVKTKFDPGFGKDIYAFGGNIYANIEVDGNIGKIFSIGGEIGTDFDYAFTTISCKGSINKIKTISKKGDYEVLGGYIHSNIDVDKNIKEIIAIGGDIVGTTEIDPEDIGDEAIDYRIFINAKTIKSIKCFAQKNLFKDGPNPIDDWYYEIYGGSIAADINLKGSNINPQSIKKLVSKGGSACVYLNANGNIGQITVNSIKCREYLDDEFENRGGDIFNSAFLPKVVFKSTSINDYNGNIKFFNVSGSFINSWLGMKGPFRSRKIKVSKSQLVNSEIWIDAKPYLSN